MDSHKVSETEDLRMLVAKCAGRARIKDGESLSSNGMPFDIYAID